jgi:hypothetical protein
MRIKAKNRMAYEDYIQTKKLELDVLGLSIVQELYYYPNENEKPLRKGLL